MIWRAVTGLKNRSLMKVKMKTSHKPHSVVFFFIVLVSQ